MHSTPASPRPAQRRPAQRRFGLHLLALLAIPLMLLLHAPVLAAVVPGALWTIAALAERDVPPALPAAELVGADEWLELERLAAATPVDARSRRIT
jgi:hypothetical protein